MVLQMQLRARQKLEFQLALSGKQVTEFACQSKFSTCPCLKKFLLLINNSRDMDKDLIKSFMSDRSPSVEHFGRSFTFTILLIS